ncbi:MAG: sulfur carrier protein ThiS [Oligoflexus sp.]
MNLKVNGKDISLQGPMTVDQFLEHMGYKNRFVAVAINHNCIPRSQFSEHHVQADDQVEILAPMAGG